MVRPRPVGNEGRRRGVTREGPQEEGPPRPSWTGFPDHGAPDSTTRLQPRPDVLRSNPLQNCSLRARGAHQSPSETSVRAPGSWLCPSCPDTPGVQLTSGAKERETTREDRVAPSRPTTRGSCGAGILPAARRPALRMSADFKRTYQATAAKLQHVLFSYLGN